MRSLEDEQEPRNGSPMREVHVHAASIEGIFALVSLIWRGHRLIVWFEEGFGLVKEGRQNQELTPDTEGSTRAKDRDGT